MTETKPNPDSTAPIGAIEKNHHADAAWDHAMARIRAEIAARQAHPARTVVLLPYAQLIPEARNAWFRVASGFASPAQPHFLPRFETTMNWSRSLGGVAAAADDLRLETGHDLLTAASLLSRAGLGGYQDLLSQRLMEAAWSLARVAAAVEPAQRLQWGAQCAATLTAGLDDSLLGFEAATARIALAWAASSGYPTDPVFAATPDLLVLLSGFQVEPLTLQLRQRMGERAVALALAAPPGVDAGTGALSLHAAQDAEDEAQRAGACVLAHLAAGRSPVALVAQDRVLTRRVCAMLGQRGVALRDETGWKLSTTRAAASLMSLLRALVWDASTDAVLDWVKCAPAFAARSVAQSEINWRRIGARNWHSVPPDDALKGPVQAVRDALQSARPLSRWLSDVRLALENAGQWGDLLRDPAGQAVLDALRLHDGAPLEFADVTARLSLGEFTAWVSQTLEGMSFSPPHPSRAQVVVLPLSQLLGRPLAAVVLPGCDEYSLPVSPEPPGPWTSAQRALLGLPSREQLADAERASWRYALRFPYVDLLWRHSEAGEHLMPTGLVQELLLRKLAQPALDPSLLRAVVPRLCSMPAPGGNAVAVTRLSASVYEDLRRCPYRFFALRQLRLQESDELDIELDKRDFGNWLHLVLRIFHQDSSNAAQPVTLERATAMDAAAAQASAELGLSASEFLPFAAAWPRVRDGYLHWLTGHEASGASFVAAEAWRETALGALTLVGKIDRIDRLANGTALVIDYKTETPGNTARRIKELQEDTQLAFYAALLSDDTLAGAYVNVGEKDGTRSYVQSALVELRDQLMEGIATDMARLTAGAPMAALGVGDACEYCAARGLCRKDFWEET